MSIKSIRLNKSIRAEIASNIEQAWVIKNPAPAKEVNPVEVLEA